MTAENFNTIFNPDVMRNLFPEARTDQFFDALFGDVSEGAYDISLEFEGCGQDELHFQFRLRQRPGKCLACHLTHGLPQVFSRHPVVNVRDLVREIERLMRGHGKCADWRLGTTQEVSAQLHVIPLTISLDLSG